MTTITVTPTMVKMTVVVEAVEALKAVGSRSLSPSRLGQSTKA